MNATIAQASLVIASVLFASLWQGVLIVGAVWIALRSLPRLGAATRYAIWFCTLLALVAIPVFTVSTGNRSSLLVLPAATPVAQRAAVTTIEVPARVASQSDVAPNDRAVITDPTARDSDTSATNERKTPLTILQNIGLAAALLWLLAAAARGLVLLLDLVKLVAIGRSARRWSETHGCQVFLSDSVDVPLVMGFVRPRIVLPASLVGQVSSEELESILIHEVAHLRRYDVWTNAFARMIETCIAVNPLAWFVMRQLAMEREIACDDWVVTSIGAGDGFARTLASLANRPRMPVSSAAPSILGSRHAIVIRIERLLDARPRRLRLSPAALGGALMVFALLAIVLQAVSPVLAYTPPQLTQTVTAAATSAACAVPNRGIVMTNFLPKVRSTIKTPSINVELKNNAALAIKKVGAANVATVDITVNIAGKATKVVASPNLRYASLIAILPRLYRSSGYLPALVNCVPVESTVRLSVPMTPPEPSTYSAIVPVYAAGWSDANGSCKIQSVGHRRNRIGFQGKLPYTDELPWYSGTMLQEPEGSEFVTVARVHVDADGSAARVVLSRSSGKPAFDQASLSAARRAMYPLSQQTCPTMPTDYVWTTTYENVRLIARLGKLVPAKP